jgi:hypothetical protein
MCHHNGGNENRRGGIVVAPCYHESHGDLRACVNRPVAVATLFGVMVTHMTLGERYTRVRDLRSQLISELERLGHQAASEGKDDITAEATQAAIHFARVSLDMLEGSLSR